MTVVCSKVLNEGRLFWQPHTDEGLHKVMELHLVCLIDSKIEALVQGNLMELVLDFGIQVLPEVPANNCVKKCNM